MSGKQAKKIRAEFEKQSGFEKKDQGTTAYKIGYKKKKKNKQ